MTAHIFNARLDPVDPATLSRATITGLLRGTLGHQGVVVTDDMQMGAITTRYGWETAVWKAIDAGVDLLLVCTHSKRDQCCAIHGRALVAGLLDRVAAEDRLRVWAMRHGVALSILRAPGIYTETRLPVDRLKQGTPTLLPEDDVFTNHVHATDLARAAVAALFRGRPNRAYNVTDDAEMKMGAWFDAVADTFHLPRPPRVSWEEAEQRIAPILLSFMSESRRLTNARMKRELRVRLRYPDPQLLLDEIAPRDLKKQLALPL